MGGLVAVLIIVVVIVAVVVAVAKFNFLQRLTVTRLLPIALLILCCGCLHRPAGLTYFVGPECKPSARLVNCDRSSPPRCERIRLDYQRGCEKLDLRGMTVVE